MMTITKEEEALLIMVFTDDSLEISEFLMNLIV